MITFRTLSSSSLTSASTTNSFSSTTSGTVDKGTISNGTATTSFAIHGTNGDDYLYGPLGGALDDVIYAGEGSDQIVGGVGHDRLFGQGGHDTLWGGSGNDIVDGGSGHDFISGGSGIDLLTGGAGVDTFSFSTFGSNDFDSAGFDTITDFEQGVDKIDLRNVDARPDLLNHQRWSFDFSQDGATEEFFDGLSDDWQGIEQLKGGPTINGEAGEIEIRHEGGYTYVFLPEGDGLVEASIRLKGEINLTVSDFLL
jgi:Ca2+-binding RTX toxin-like protein